MYLPTYQIIEQLQNYRDDLLLQLDQDNLTIKQREIKDILLFNIEKAIESTKQRQLKYLI